MSLSWTIFLSLLWMVAGDVVQSGTPGHCPGISFAQMNPWEWVRNANPGWNLGNTLDAIPDEGSWNNPPAVPTIFDDIKKAGFKSVRIPVTWTAKIGKGPEYLIEERWLNRVADIVEQTTSRNLYTIVNLHHDSWEWMDFTNPNNNLSVIETKFAALWKQIATKLACTRNLVAYEPINEARGATEKHAEIMNRLNKIFIDTIISSGGFNWQRMITLSGLGEDAVKTSKWFKKPEGSWRNPWAIQYHYYSPYDFVFSAWGKTIWGSQTDIDAIEADIRQVRENFTEVPLIIGEWGVSPGTTEPASRWRWTDAMARIAAKYNTATMLWDNGEHFDRQSRKWNDPTELSILMNALRGINNSLPVTQDVFINSTSSSQSTSAYIFHKLGSKLEDKVLEFNFNGNTIRKIRNSKGAELITKEHFKVESTGGKETLHILSKFLAPQVLDQTPGVKDKLTVEFTAGAAVEIEVVVWDTPSINNLLGISAVRTGSDFVVPVTWKGLSKLAAVKAVYSDGKPIADDWTQYLGPLQSGYLTYNTHWTYDAKSIIIKKDLLSELEKSRKEAIFTFDFWPRTPENRVQHTIHAFNGRF